MYNYRPPYPNELMHHGIQGQKWGVQHGPPYPLKNSFSARRKEKGHHSWYEKKMARKEKRAIKKYEKNAEKAKETTSERKKEKYEEKSAKARAKVESISETGQKYYSLDRKERRKIDRGYAAVKVLTVLASPALPVYAGVSYANRMHASNRVDKKAREKQYRNG